MVEPSGHCPHLGLKQNRAIRFASPTPEHRCYVTGDAQEIPVSQASFCLSPNHVNCPLYMGLNPPSTPEILAPAVPLEGGLRGWLLGLSQRDRFIYAVLLALLAIIIGIYLFVSSQLLFGRSNAASATPVLTPTAADMLVVATTSRPTVTVTPTPSRTPSHTATATATATITPTASLTSTSTNIPIPIVFPTATAYIPPPPPPPLPTSTPVPPPPPSDTPVPSATPVPPSPTPVPPTTAPPYPLPPTLQPPTMIVRPTAETVPPFGEQ